MVTGGGLVLLRVWGGDSIVVEIGVSVIGFLVWIALVVGQQAGARPGLLAALLQIEQAKKAANLYR